MQEMIQEMITFLNQNWAMSAALIIVFFLILVNEVQYLRKKGKEVTPQAVVNLINHESAIVLDLRDAENYKKSHIIDAIQVAPEDFEKNKMNKYKEKSIILVCDKGLKAAPLAIKLRAQGYKNPLVLSGGMAAWHAAQLPTVKAK